MNIVKKIKFVLVGIFLFLSGISHNIKAQSIELLAGNVLNGAMNGVLLGGATMALQNSNDFEPARVGVGLGILYGMGTGIYDISTVSIGDQFYISGMFNDGTNSTIIVLLDTFYGAAAGAVISTSVSLIANESILDGLQYGTSAGAWVGFGFGLIDSFMLAKRHHDIQAVPAPSNQASGLIRYSNRKNNVAVGMFNPSVYSYRHISGRNIGIRHTAGIELINLSIGL